MGKITDMDRMVVKNFKTGETVELVLGELPKDLTCYRRWTACCDCCRWAASAS